MDNELYLMTCYDDTGLRVGIYIVTDKEYLFSKATEYSQWHKTVKTWKCIEVTKESDGKANKAEDISG